MHMDFWNRVDFLVKEHKSTLTKLWEVARINPNTGSGWRRDDRYPDAESLIRIADAVGASAEWLITGEEISMEDDDYVKNYDAKIRSRYNKSPQTIITNKGKETETKPEEPTVLVPIYSQKLSAGYGEIFSDEEVTGYIRIPKRMTRGIPSDRLGAAEVKGDSMIGVQIYAGDLVFFAKDAVDEGDGLYAVALGDAVLVKRVNFNPVDETVTISSENPKYDPITVKADSDNVRLLGKVIGWVHQQPF